MTGHPTALGQSGNGPWLSARATGSADGAPSQGYGQSGSQRAVGCCGHYLQHGAAHGHSVHLEESGRTQKKGKS